MTSSFILLINNRRQIPWDSHAAKLVINDYLTIAPKSSAVFLKSVTGRNFPTQYNVEGQENLRVHVFNIACGGWGGAGDVHFESRANMCLARV